MTTFGRVKSDWVYGGSLAGVLLLGLAPVLTAGWDRAAALAYLALPLYMLHQLEEHDGDRFRAFVNDLIGHGREVLSVSAVFWINFLGVWVLLGAGIWLARVGGPGWAALAGWLVLVNGLLHLAQGIALRRYNPGLASAVAVFLPLGALTLAAARPVASGAEFWTSALVAVLVHAAIVAHVRMEIKKQALGAAT